MCSAVITAAQKGLQKEVAVEQLRVHMLAFGVDAVFQHVCWQTL